MKALAAFGLLLVTSTVALADQASYSRPHLAHDAAPATLELKGQRYLNLGLVGTGRLAAATRDFQGDTLGSFSSLKVLPGSWRRVGDHYEGVLWTLPDRGQNDPGAGKFFDYANRINRFEIRFSPYLGKADLAASPSSQHQLQLQPRGGLILRDDAGRPFTGAEPRQGQRQQHGLILPSPGAGIGAGKLSLDAESLAIRRDGSFYVGDEYAGNVYYFDAGGVLRGVIQPSPALRPMSGGQPDFTSLKAPASGRRNNQGAEGMAVSPDGRRLFLMMQSALVQDSVAGDDSARNHTRVLVYDIASDPLPRRPVGDYVLALPRYRSTGDGGALDRTAAQSEILALDDHRLLILSRDSNGLGSDDSRPPVFKSVLLADLEGASNLLGTPYDRGTASVLQPGAGNTLRPAITPVAWGELVNLLHAAQLRRFGLNLETRPKNQPLSLSEKWEAMDLLPALDPSHPQDYFLLVGNDNDFIARDCVMGGIRCDAGFDNDNLILVYRLRLPKVQPLPADAFQPTEPSP